MSINRKERILISILIAIVAILSLAFSYAFVRLNEDDNDQIIDTSSSRLSLFYNECSFDGDEACGLINKDLKVNDSFTKKFSITNKGSRDVNIPLYFTSLKNSFKNDELIYSIRDITNGIVLITEPVPYYPEITENIEAYPNLTIKKGETIDYEITVTFIDVGADQNYNISAEYFIKLGLVEMA